MTINFEEIKRQNIDFATILRILEIMYNEKKQSRDYEIVLNEFVPGVTQVYGKSGEFVMTLSKNPISINDILIVSECGTIVVTPQYITELKENKLHIKSSKLSNGMNFFVTYKY